MDAKTIKNYQYLSNVLSSADAHECICLTYNNYYSIRHNPSNGFKNFLAIGQKNEKFQENEPFEQLKYLLNKENSKVFGHFSYDLKNHIEDLRSLNPSTIPFPDIHFFSPEELYEFRSLEELATFEIPKANHKRMHQHNPNNLSLQAKISKDEYLDCVRDIIKHIKLGNIYEVNFAQEFVVRNVQIDPVRLFIKFLDHSNAPFSAFYKIGDHYAICGSPERFIKGKGDRICSEPIKGTIRTSVNPLENEALIDQLLHSSKDRSENIMAVDVVRNDLSRTAEKGSVVVTDLCRLETFQKVHHLISSIESKRKKGMTNVDVIQHAFPMASMTGAPKISAMKYIERYENFRRGLYSGSIGYFDLENDSFDFNVVIRTIQYDASKHILSFATGGAITALSNPEEEYQECFVKAKSIMQTLFD